MGTNAVYLYTTKDPVAGAPITSVDIKSVSKTYTAVPHETVAGWLNEDMSEVSGADMNYGTGVNLANYLVYRTDASETHVFLRADDFFDAYEALDVTTIKGLDNATSITSVYTNLKNNKSAIVSQEELNLLTETLRQEKAAS